jgi:hypothetical protein
MKKIEAHIDRLFRGIPDSRRKSEMMQEISDNLDEKVADLISQGKTEDEAVKKAMEDFGDIDDIRRELMSSAQLIESRNVGLSLAFSVWGGILVTALFLFINFYYTPRIIWFVYPVFAVAWWPMSVFFRWVGHRSGHSVAFPYAVASFILIMGLLLFINFYYTPRIIWFVYPAFAVIWWPIAVFFHRLRQKNREEDSFE